MVSERSRALLHGTGDLWFESQAQIQNFFALQKFFSSLGLWVSEWNESTNADRINYLLTAFFSKFRTWADKR